MAQGSPWLPLALSAMRALRCVRTEQSKRRVHSLVPWTPCAYRVDDGGRVDPGVTVVL